MEVGFLVGKSISSELALLMSGRFVPANGAEVRRTIDAVRHGLEGCLAPADFTALHSQGP